MAAARRNCDGAAVLLRARQTIRKPIIRRDMIKLGSRLVVPGTPGLRAINCDDGALVAAQHHPIRIIGIDPKLMVVVTTRRALDSRPTFSGVGRAID